MIWGPGISQRSSSGHTVSVERDDAWSIGRDLGAVEQHTIHTVDVGRDNGRNVNLRGCRDVTVRIIEKADILRYWWSEGRCRVHTDMYMKVQKYEARLSLPISRPLPYSFPFSDVLRFFSLSVAPVVPLVNLIIEAILKYVTEGTAKLCEPVYSFGNWRSVSGEVENHP